MTDMLVPLDDRARREWIKYQLRVRGSSLSALARELGVSRHATRLALDKPYPRMERAIAAKLGLQPKQLWPERYDEQGRPNRTIGRPKPSSHGDRLNQKPK
jgi:Ner family transcriptional regulator